MNRGTICVDLSSISRLVASVHRALLLSTIPFIRVAAVIGDSFYTWRTRIKTAHSPLFCDVILNAIQSVSHPAMWTYDVLDDQTGIHFPC